MFYTKRIEIWHTGEREMAGGVIVEDEKTKVGEMMADVQPYSRSAAYYDYGLNIDVSHAVFIDPVQYVIPGKSIIKYNGDEYDVIETMEWDNHTEILVNRRR